MNEPLPIPNTVAVLGASHNESRASYQAISMLMDRGYTVYPIHPKIDEIQNLKVLRSLSEIPEPIDTLTLYLSEKNSTSLEGEILETKPRRIIFNPGSENASLYHKAQSLGIEVEAACSLVLLGTGQF